MFNIKKKSALYPPSAFVCFHIMVKIRAKASCAPHNIKWLVFTT